MLKLVDKLMEGKHQHVKIISLFVLFVVAILDYISGLQLLFSIFYLLPILLVTWYSQDRSGYLFCIVASIIWLMVEYSSNHTYTNELVPLWNMLVRLSFFMMMTYLLSELQKHEIRRRALERIFFHDILNIVGSVRGYAELLKDNEVPRTQEIYNLLYECADRSLEDIEAQRMLANAENDEFHIELTNINSQLLIDLIVNLYKHHEASKNRTIYISDEAEIVELESDLSLLSRVIGNMLKNALESSMEAGDVTIGCSSENEMACFWVHNQGYIEPDIQGQIFKQATSTKSKNRGIGTYSMKLLTNRLHGKISFNSNKQNGTTFKACYPIRFPKH